MVRKNILVPDPLKRPTLTVPEAAAILGVGKNTGYEMVKRGEMHAIHIGKRVVIPTALFLKSLGIEFAKPKPKKSLKKPAPVSRVPKKQLSRIPKKK